jgi:hypothetical protein
MSEYDDLIKYFGSSGKSTGVTTEFHDLINEFGGGEVKATPSAPEVSTAPPIMTPDEIAEGQRKFNAPTPTKFSELPIIRHGIEGFQSSKALITSGAKDISQNMPATGIGKAALGLAGVAGNLTGILPTIEAGKEQLTKISGNPEFADRATMVATSGLPISKVGSAVNAAMPSNRALATLVETIGKDNLKPVIDQLKSNPRLTLMDVEPNIQVIAQGMAARPGDPRNILDKVVKTRKDTRLDTVTGAFDDAMGVPPNVLEKVEGLKKQIRDTGKEINPIIKSSKPVDISPVIASIDAKLKPGVNSVITAGEPLPLGDIEKSLEGVKKLLTDGKSVRTDAQSLHNFQSSLRAKAEDLLGSSSGQDRQLGKALMDTRNQIVSSIDKASPQIQDAAGNSVGTYRPALAKYRDVNDIEDAFKKGQLITKNKLGHLEDDPSYWDKWIKEATPQELEAAKEGARLAVRHQMGSVVNAARKGETVPQVAFNKEKLQLLFGKDEVEKMAKTLSDESKIADTNSKLFQNSMTAMRLLGAEATKVRPDYQPNFTKTILPAALEAGTQYLSGGALPVAGMTVGLAYPAIRSKFTKIGQKLDNKTNTEIATLASSTGEAKDNLIRYLESQLPKPKRSMLQKGQSFMLPVLPP